MKVRILVFAILASLIFTSPAAADEGCDQLVKSSSTNGLGYDFIQTQGWAKYIAENKNLPRLGVCISRNVYAVSVAMVDECLDTGNFWNSAYRATFASCTAEMSRLFTEETLRLAMGLDG